MSFITKLFQSSKKPVQGNVVVLPILMLNANGKLEEQKLILQLDEHQVNVQKRRGKCVVKSLGIAELQEVICGRVLKEAEGALKKKKMQPGCCVSLVVNKTEDEMEIIARTPDAAQNLVELLKRMQRAYKSSVKDKLDDWILVYFNEADKSKNGTLSLDEICRVVQKLGCNLKREEIRERFNAANRNADDSLNVEEFRSFFHDLLALAEIDSVFTEFGGDAFLDFGEFKTFLSNALHIGALSTIDTLRRFEGVLSAYERSDEARRRSLLTNDGFRLMYVSGCPLVSVFNEPHAVVYQDMNRPLGDFWIDSSHNTYLEGRQVFGTSSADAYRQALRLGCRSVELDIWDGKDEPIITHGYTYTSHLLLSEALKAINETAFEKSPYPVILSLENHMSLEYQRMAADLFIRIFGDRLYTTKHLPGTPLPSPEQLKYKIILKGKSLKDKDKEEKDIPRQETLADEDDDGEPAADTAGPQHDDAAGRGNDGQRAKNAKKKESEEVASELSELIVMCKSVSFHGYEKAYSNQQVTEMSSLVETKAAKLAENDSGAFVRYTNAFMVRIYPKGTRVDSGNYDPVPFWNVGCQLVASNVQRQDEAFAIGRALFADNGHSGYVLKPPLLLQGVPDTPIELSICVISGFQLPHISDHLDPVVTVSVNGVKADAARQSTPVVKRNSFHPVWNASFTFLITTPSLAFIRFVVHDDDDTEKRVSAQNAFRVINLANGFRALPLLDANHSPDEKAFLFVKISTRPSTVDTNAIAKAH